LRDEMMNQTTPITPTTTAPMTISTIDTDMVCS
jgi:hypothetical protein